MLREFVRRLPPARVFLAGLGLLVLTTTACIQELIERGVSAYLGDALQFGEDPGPPRYEAKSFVNWETPHVSPLALSPDGRTLLAVNTADARVERFDVSGDAPVPIDSIPVGLDPASVRFRSDAEAWVANHVSDSISIIDLPTGNVVRTLQTADEPTDIAFAAGRAFVTCSQANQVFVFDLADLAAQPTVLEIQGEDPRALAVSPDGRRVYAAIFESGNHSTLVPWESVSDRRGPYAGVNPPPNRGAAFQPAIDPGLPPPPPVSLIVKQDPRDGAWLDEQGVGWHDFVTWDQHDHDVAIVDAQTLGVGYVRGVMNANMHLAVDGDGRVVVVGTDAFNEVRFEPNLTGRFVRSLMAVLDGAPTPGDVYEPARQIDLNPHLAEAYAAGASRVPPELRIRSIADPRGIALSAEDIAFITGMGSNNLIATRHSGERLGEVAVGQGPTGVVLDASRGRAYVLNKFEASVSVIDVSNPRMMREAARVAFFDPTPATIRDGRPFLYDAHRTSGLGVTACAACHLDARTDQLAWDLGDPAGATKPLDQECNRPFLNLPVGSCEDFHPMKGPMTTQTLQNIIGTEPFHWRGDRTGIEEFNPAFVGLLGADRELMPEEMAAFKEFLRTIVFPPNPNRNLDNTLKERIPIAASGETGDPRQGEKIYFNQGIDLGLARCNDCHDAYERGAGTNHRITPRNLLINPHQSIDVPQIRNMYEKSGFSRDRRDNSVGFGHNHDGTIDGLVNFFHIPNFTGFADGEKGERERRDVIAYVMSFSTDTHAGVGAQVTLDRPLPATGATRRRIDTMLEIADRGDVGLIVKGRIDGAPRGFVYLGNWVFASDRAAEGLVSFDELAGRGRPGGELTWTLVPAGTQYRMGVDRNEDGIRDGDE